jgi:hypothetical protein
MLYRMPGFARFHLEGNLAIRAFPLTHVIARVAVRQTRLAENSVLIEMDWRVVGALDRAGRCLQQSLLDRRQGLDDGLGSSGHLCISHQAN